MPFNVTFESLAKKGCTSDVATLLPHVFERAADRSLLLSHPFTVTMTLWTLLRWEKSVAHLALRRLGVDFGRLEKQVDSLLDQCEHGPFRSQEQVQQELAHSEQEAAETIRSLLERAMEEAASMRNSWVGTEHLLLAIILLADASLSSILAHSGINYQGAREAIHNVLDS